MCGVRNPYGDYRLDDFDVSNELSSKVEFKLIYMGVFHCLLIQQAFDRGEIASEIVQTSYLAEHQQSKSE